MKRINNRRAVKQPTRIAAPPRFAERLYVGIMSNWADEFKRAVLNELDLNHDQQSVAILNVFSRLDAKDEQKSNWFVALAFGIGSRLIAGVRRKLEAVAAWKITRVGREIAVLVKNQTIRVLGTEPERIAVSHSIEPWVHENVQLIEGMREEQLQRIEQLLNNNKGLSIEKLAADLLREFDITANRARKIAADQTLKLNARMTQEAHRQSGITKYEWESMEDEKVRNKHVELARRSSLGEVFSYDDPPVSEDDGTRHNPGEGYECRCRAKPCRDELPNV
jgi:SPP1 gp7 family putative phage head morphogenesis protein